ncbi:MAG: hypothetical protein JW863_00930 [Chitinispirillaceae bacterium]|nr:hypothetical protein [Chitinispirillaceae bacterium]
MKLWKKIVITVVSGGMVILQVGYLVWNPGPASTQRYDTGTNGIWIGHQWYTGVNVRTGVAVSPGDRKVLIGKFDRYGIRDVFIHAGPVNADGTVDDMPGVFFDTLRMLTPDIRYIPWIGGNAHSLPLENPGWRRTFMRTLGELHARGCNGVHLDIEPLSSFHPGYLELLQEIRETFEKDFFISHATRRAALTDYRLPVLSKFCWSMKFYRACMEKSDQTVLMGYDTCIRLEKVYRAFIRFQTERLLECADSVPGHRVMIGIPSYEDVPKFSDPRVENIHNAALGVRAALEARTALNNPFDGVAVYACWTTDSTEWRDYEAYWMNRF